MLDGTPGEALVDGCAIRYWRAGPRGAPRVVLLHGGEAHAGWWAWVLPGLARSRDVLAVDLSGHGDSGHRSSYSPGGWAGEVVEAVAATGGGPVSLVGHSMGGLVGVFAAAARPDVVARLVVVDTGLREPGTQEGPRGRLPRSKRVYATLDEALARFKLYPPETVAPPERLAAVGRAGLRQVPGGWTWKFDPARGGRFSDDAIHEALAGVRVPLGIVYGEWSQRCGPEVVSYVERTLGRRVPSVCVPAAYHHVPLDQPEACLSAVEQVLADLPRAA